MSNSWDGIRETAWQPIETLVRDGRQVMFRAANGQEYEAPAGELRPASREMTKRLVKEGIWPDHKAWRQTHWREKED